MLSKEQRDEWRRLAEAARPEDDWAKDRVALTWTPPKVKQLAEVWYDDGDECAEVHDNLGMGCDGNAYAALFSVAPVALPACLDEINRLEAALLAERQRCANIARERQKHHDERCRPECRCADGHHIAMAILEKPHVSQ